MAYYKKRGGYRRFRSYGRRFYGSSRRFYGRSKSYANKNKKTIKWLTIALVVFGVLALFAPKYINQFKSKLGLLKNPIA